MRVLITGAGAPGIIGTIYSIRNNFDGRKCHIIGTDSNAKVVGKTFADSFHTIPKADTPRYLEELLAICERTGTEVLIPQNTVELEILADNRQSFERIGTKVLVSDSEAVSSANDKERIAEIARSNDIPTAISFSADNAHDLLEKAGRLGWPNIPVVVKPPNSNGSRGLRVIDESVDLKRRFYEEKQGDVLTKMEVLLKVLGDDFPRLMVMEYLPGLEYSVDVLCAERVTAVPRLRTAIRSGITFAGRLDRQVDIIDYSERLCEVLGLKYAVGLQLKMDEDDVPKLLESNPRVQGTMVMSTLAGANIIYGAVKHALGEVVPVFNIDWDLELMRYWGGVGIVNDRARWLL